MSDNPFALPSGRKISDALAYSATDENSAHTSEIELITIPLDRIIPDPDQPRKLFTSEVIHERQQQLESNGQLEPITVLPGEATEDGIVLYKLVDGECRWRAAKQSEKINSLYAQIYKGNPEDKYTIIKTQILSNNDGSADITNFERSVSYVELVKLAEEKDHDFVSASECVANELGKDISEFYRILKLSSVTDRVKDFCLTSGIDDAKAVSSITQIMKAGGESAFNEMNLEYKKNGLSGKTTRKHFSDIARIVKGKDNRGKPKATKQEKKIRRLSATHIKLIIGGIEIETPREVFKLTIEHQLISNLFKTD